MPDLKNSAEKNLHYIRKVLYRISFAGLSICLRFRTFQGSEYGSGCKHTMVLYIPGFWRHQVYVRVLDIPVFWICQVSEYVMVLNIPGFWIYHSSEHTGVTQASECAVISLDTSWICLVMTEYARMLNTNSTLLGPVSWRSGFVIFANLCIIFVKFSIVEVWEGCDILEILNIPKFGIWVWFWIY